DPAAFCVENLPEELSSQLDALKEIPFQSEFYRVAKLANQRQPLLDNRRFFSVENGLADKFTFYQHLLTQERVDKRDVHIVWKNYSADPLVRSLFDRCFGIRGTVAKDDQDLETTSKMMLSGLVGGEDHRSLQVHVEGVKIWKWLDNLAGKHQKVQINGVSHTTSDADEIRRLRQELSNVSVSVMADSPAKRRYERFMFTSSFERMLEKLPRDFDASIPDLADRHVVVYGGAGGIVGHSILDAIMRLRTADLSSGHELRYPRVTTIDPRADDPDFRQRRRELKAAGINVVAGKEAPADVYQDKKLVVVNATANDVWLESDYAKLQTNDLVVMNLGTGQKGFSMSAVAAQSNAVSQLGPDGHEPSRSYSMTVEGSDGRMKPLTVHALGNGYPYNLTTRIPNPTTYSNFNNLLILEGLHESRWAQDQNRAGARVLSSVRVSFTSDDPPRPVVFLVDPDVSPDLPWPLEFDPPARQFSTYQSQHIDDTPLFLQVYRGRGAGSHQGVDRILANTKEARAVLDTFVRAGGWQPDAELGDLVPYESYKRRDGTGLMVFEDGVVSMFEREPWLRSFQGEVIDDLPDPTHFSLIAALEANQ
ncbi:hypothetical protein ACFL6C_12435, partial [Myxococcota bacterium]